jgi:hypothetical protein
MVDTLACTKQRSQGAMPLGAKHQSEAAGRGEDLRTPVKVNPIMVDALRGQKFDFQSPRGLDTGQRVRGGGQRPRNRKRRGPGPNEASILRKGLGGKDPEVR